MAYYEDRPLITRLLLRQAARKVKLDADGEAALAEILSSRENIKVAGSVLDDLPNTVEVVDGKVGALGDGTILKLLLENLPAIVQAILEILKALQTP